MLERTCLMYTFLLLGISVAAHAAIPPDAVNCYVPIEGGWMIRLSGNPTPTQVEPGGNIGVARGDARLHRRPLYPPSDRSLIWTDEQIRRIERVASRPLILAYNEPRFIFDAWTAGGLLGHLFVGLVDEKGASRWFHQFSEIEVRYVDGRMEYTLTDPAFPGVTARLSAAALAENVGFVLSVQMEGTANGNSLVWAYGGASAYTTNYNMTAPEFSFSPVQCRKDRISWHNGMFTLRRSFDDSDEYKKVFPEWEAHIRGGSDKKGESGLGDPEYFQVGPQELLKTADPDSSSIANEKENCVAVQSIPLVKENQLIHIVIGMGRNIEKDIQSPNNAYESALNRNQEMANRVITKTPDPYLDSAMSMMAFATDGLWGDTAILHGAWSWRYAYLGWRGWYGPICYGWSDRIQKSIRNHTTMGLIRTGDDQGALCHILEANPTGTYYNMNEVFLDQVRQYFDYTNDLDLMREIFPVLLGILDWENRRLRPGEDFLYESSLNTWISDSHWYIRGQCAQASAYMLGAYRLLADLAERLGDNPTPYRKQAENIRKAMQEILWMPQAGVFAEYLDTLGNRQLHTEPELPTIYHSAEFGAANDTQIRQMLDWAETHLRTESTPGSGKLYWSSNWHPNSGRSYTHSTYEMAYGEELNLALTNYLVGRGGNAYRILRAVLCGIFNGPTPGGLSCHSFVDGTQRANDEFADAISMWGRTVVEGLFGIVPKIPDGYIQLTPQFPREWEDASIQTPLFSYEWRRAGASITISWKSERDVSVHFRIPFHAGEIRHVRLNGNPAKHRMESDKELSWFFAETPVGNHGTLELQFTHSPAPEMPVPVKKEELESARRVWSAPEVPKQDLSLWTLVDLKDLFNSPVSEVLQRAADAATPPPLPANHVNFGYWKEHFWGSRIQAPCDDAWRRKVGEDGIAWTADGIPFMSVKDGNNIAAVTLVGGFPQKLTFPIHTKGQTLYLMVSGITFPAQSHVVNLRVSLQYADGRESVMDLVNPFDIGDCWSTWCGRYHDTAANGFENIGGRSGPSGSCEVEDMSKPVALDSEAHLIPFDLLKDVELASVEVEAVANDVLFGVMGATVLK
ncbi:MAG TPA: DUF4450 domain-containing protein [bacterium]|nr:DUF4450 domain-containing protein [bacterium]